LGEDDEDRSRAFDGGSRRSPRPARRERGVGRRPSPLPVDEQEIVEELLPLRSPVVYEIVRQEGETELARPLASLWWSGIAAGFGIFPSVIALGALREYLPDAPWRPLVESVGYSLGFLIVILGRLQLFTENTITAVLPLLANWSGTTLAQTLRLWAVVFAANLVGVALTAALVIYAGLVPGELLPSLLAVAGEFGAHTAVESFFLGIPAGFLLAALVWMLPNCEGFEFSVIVSLTYLIALGGFTHAVVGAAELSLVVLAGELGLLDGLAVLGPTFAGNVVGGTGLFALLAYAQVRMEL
jgi:formate/nitrite transporter FocA (FNT family)